MINSVQILLTFVVVVLTTILTIVGVEVFLILREFRESIRKMNKILDDAGLISESIAKPISELSDLASGLQALAGFIKSFLKERKTEDKVEEKKIEEPPPKEETTSSNSSPRRFFLRAGKKLA